jgi:hypothetical protein
MSTMNSRAGHLPDGCKDDAADPTSVIDRAQFLRHDFFVLRNEPGQIRFSKLFDSQRRCESWNPRPAALPSSRCSFVLQKETRKFPLFGTIFSEKMQMVNLHH